MRKFTRHIDIIKTCNLVLLLFFFAFTVSAQNSSLTAISNTQGAPASMKISDLKSILKGEKQRWSDGTRVIIFLMKTSTPVGETTCRKIYNMSSDKVKRYWLGLSFSGKATAPTFCNSIEELETLVSQTPGAIGIIDKNPTSPSTKIVLVDGKNSF